MEGAVLLLIIQLSLCVRGVPLNTLDITVSVNTSQWIHLVDDRFLSLSVPPTFFLTDNYSNATKNMLHSLSPAYLRVGGFQSDNLYFNLPTNDSDGIIVTMRQWKALQQLAEDSGVKLIFTVNPSPRQLASDNWDNSDILKLLQLSDEQGVNMTSYWQLGYAPYLAEMSGLTLGRDVTRLHKVLDLFPRYQSTAVLGPDFPLCVSPDCLRFLRNYLLKTGDIVNALIFQMKPEIEEWQEKVAIEKLTRVINDVDAKILTRNTLESNTFTNVPKKQLWIKTGMEEYTGEFTDALVWALRVGHTAKLGYDVVLQQLGSLTEPTPDYWVSLMFHRVVGRAVLDAYPAVHPSMTVFAHCSSSSYKPGAITVWGVNAAESVLSLNLPHSHALVYSLTAGYHGSTLLNGKELRLMHGISLPELHPTREVTAGPVSVPAYSVFYIVLPDLKAPACKTYTNLNSPSTNLLQRETIPHVAQSRIEHIGHYSTSDSGYNSKLKIMEQSTEMNGDNVKETFEKASQYLSNNDKDLIDPLAKKTVTSKMEKKTTESGFENKMFGLFNYLRFKRSLSRNSQVTDSEISEPPPSPPRRLSNMPFNSLKKLQQIYKVMDDDNFQKSQRELLPKNSTYKEINSHIKETSNILYFPGEFYNKLRTLVSKSNKQQSDMEDPHEAVAVVSEHLPTYSIDESTLKVTNKPSNDPTLDMKIVEQTTETMEHYYKHAEQFLNQASCGNSKHKEKMTCCMGHIKPTEIHSSQFELKDEEMLNESLKDRGLKNNESLQITKNKNKDAHIETLYKRMKREINKYIQSNESPFLNTTKLMPVEQNVKDPLEDDESITLYLEELTDEGEQLLKTFDRDYGTNHLDDKFTSGTSLNADNKYVSDANKTGLNVSNDFVTNRMSKVSTKLATNKAIPYQKSKLDIKTENEGRSRFNSSSLVVSEPIKGESKPELVVVVSKLNSEMENGKSSQSKNENTFDRYMASTVEKLDQLPIISKELSDSSTIYPLHYFSNESSSSSPEVKNLPKFVEKSDKHSKESTFKNNPNPYDQVGNLNKAISYVLNTQTYQTSTPPNVQSDFPVRLDSFSSTQLKLNKQSNTSTLPIYRLQRTRVRPAFPGSSIFKTTGHPPPTGLRMRVTNMRKQRLEALRARLNKAREIIKFTYT